MTCGTRNAATVMPASRSPRNHASWYPRKLTGAGTTGHFRRSRLCGSLTAATYPPERETLTCRKSHAAAAHGLHLSRVDDACRAEGCAGQLNQCDDRPG